MFQLESVEEYIGYYPHQVCRKLFQKFNSKLPARLPHTMADQDRRKLHSYQSSSAYLADQQFEEKHKPTDWQPVVGRSFDSRLGTGGNFGVQTGEFLPGSPWLLKLCSKQKRNLCLTAPNSASFRHQWRTRSESITNCLLLPEQPALVNVTE